MKRLLLLVLSILMLTDSACALEFPCDGTVEDADALLWVKPGEDEAPVPIEPGTPCRILGETEWRGEVWYQVEDERGRQGFLHEEYMSIPEGMVQDAPGGDAALMKVVVKAACEDYNHVGKSWTQHFKVCGLVVKDERQGIAVAPDVELPIYVKIVEHDKYCDVGCLRETYVPTAAEVANGFALTRMISVREGSGRYAGCEAVWMVTITFEPMQ